jgi:hypothetical protein
MSDKITSGVSRPNPDQPVDDDYWASEPIENDAVAEWWAQQPEARRYTCGITGTDTCPSDVEKTKECPSC